MVRKEKLLEEFLRNPNSLRYYEIEKLLLYLGFTKANIRGSHIKFRHHLLERNLIIPIHDGDCKIVYKQMIAKIIKLKIL
jgi:predicted RNA binding protein YcfA (HicA-like mRNA interferase family)